MDYYKDLKEYIIEYMIPELDKIANDIKTKNKHPDKKTVILHFREKEKLFISYLIWDALTKYTDKILTSKKTVYDIIFAYDDEYDDLTFLCNEYLNHTENITPYIVAKACLFKLYDDHQDEFEKYYTDYIFSNFQK